MLNDCGLRIVLIADDDEKLLGVLTDGDVRRALIQGSNLACPVSEVMCRLPKVTGLHVERSDNLAMMRHTGLLHLPIVDSDHRLIGLESFSDVVDSACFDNPVFIMAGGYGKRLYPLTAECPKPMLSIGGRPLLELIIQRFIDSGFHNFFISTHYLSSVITDHFGDGRRMGVNIKYVHERTPLGTGGALGLLPIEEIALPLIMINGDLLTELDFPALLAFHEENVSGITICGREFHSQLPFGVIKNNGIRVCGIDEKPVETFLVNAGIYVISPEVISTVKHYEKIDMPEFIEEKLASGIMVNVFPVHESWRDIGQPEDLQYARFEYSGDKG